MKPYYDRAGLTMLIGTTFTTIRRLAIRVILTPGMRNVHRYPPPDWMFAWVVPAGNGVGPYGDAS
jgi:hypothetical protein